MGNVALRVGCNLYTEYQSEGESGHVLYQMRRKIPGFSRGDIRIRVKSGKALVDLTIGQLLCLIFSHPGSETMPSMVLVSKITNTYIIKLPGLFYLHAQACS